MKVSTLDIDFFDDMKTFFETEGMKEKNVKLYSDFLDEKFDFEKQNACQIKRENQKRITDAPFANSYFNVFVFSKLRITAIEIKEKIIERYGGYSGLLGNTTIASANVGEETQSFIKENKVWIESVEIHFFYRLQDVIYAE